MNISISKKNDLMICARNSQIICKIKPKSWLQILGQESGFLVLGLQSWI